MVQVLRSRAYDGLVTEAEAVLAQEEPQHA